MGDLRVGEEVFDETGRPTPVVAATGIMLNRTCAEVVFSDGQSIVADLAHRWLTQSKSERKHGRPGTVRTTGEIADSLVAGNEWNHHIPLAGAVHYPEQPLPIDPYVLGIWLGDGTSSKAEVTVGLGDEQILEEISQAGYAVWHATSERAFRIGGLSHRHIGRVRDAVTGQFAPDGSLSSEFEAMGLLRNKHVPEMYLRASVRQRLALLQGFMDSDGYIDVYGRCEFCNTNERLADAVVELAASLGLRPVKRKKRVTLNGIEQTPRSG